jgi:antitoxin ParD1/3/4
MVQSKNNELIEENNELIEELMRNTSVILSDHFEQFIEAQVAKGRYGSASEVIRNALRLMEEREQELEWIRAELIKGEQSGIAEDFSFDKLRAEIRAKAAQP